MTILQTAVSLHLDMLPPTTNHMYIQLRNGGKALTPEVNDFRNQVALAVRGLAMAPNEDLCCTVVLTYGTKRRQDIDNRLKSLGDALALALGFDDSRITLWIAEAVRGKANGIDVTLEVRDE